MKALIQTQLEEFFTAFEHVTYEKGATIINPDETPQVAYYIHTGYVRNYSLSLEGIELTLHMFAPRSYFPMISVLSDLKNRYYYEALTDTNIYKAPKDKVITYLLSHPEVLLDLTTRLLNGLDKLTMRVEYLALESAGKRMASTLIFLSRHFGIQTENTVQFKQQFTHRDMASFAGISRETASREWEKLRKSGLVSMTGQYITLPDIQKLSELSTM